MKRFIEGTIAGLVWVNRNNKNWCEIVDLVPNWEKLLSDYMSSRYIKCNTFDGHNSYFIAIEDVDEDTIDMINSAKVAIYSIDYIVDTIFINFKDQTSRDLVFAALNGQIA